MKKIISLLLSIAMLLGVFVIPLTTNAWVYYDDNKCGNYDNKSKCTISCSTFNVLSPLSATV